MRSNVKMARRGRMERRDRCGPDESMWDVFSDWRFMFRFLMMVIITLVLVYESSAIGISPSERRVYLDSGGEMEHYVHIINNERRDLDVSLWTEVELADCIVLNESSISMSPDEAMRRVYYTIDCYEDLLPGNYDIWINAMETGIPAGMIGTTLTVSSLVDVILLHDGKYAHPRLEVDDAEEDDMLSIDLSVENLGSDDIPDLYSEISFYDRESLVSSVMTGHNVLLRKGKTQLKAEGVAAESIGNGEYSAVAKVMYDGEIVEASDDFTIGRPYADVSGIHVKRRDEGMVVIALNLTSDWNGEVDDASAELEIMDEDDVVLGSARSPFVGLVPGNDSEVEVFVEVSEAVPEDALVSVTTDVAGNRRMTRYDALFRKEPAVSDHAVLVKILLVLVIMLLASLHVHRLYAVKGRRKKSKVFK